MTVKELKEALKNLPDDAKVYYDAGEYIGNFRQVSVVDHVKKGTLAQNVGVYLT